VQDFIHQQYVCLENLPSCSVHAKLLDHIIPRWQRALGELRFLSPSEAE